MTFKLKDPLRFEITVVPKKGKDAGIDFKVYAGKGEQPSIEVIFYVFYTIFKSLLRKTIENTDAKDLETLLVDIEDTVKTGEPKVKTLDRIKKLFIA